MSVATVLENYQKVAEAMNAQVGSQLGLPTLEPALYCVTTDVTRFDNVADVEAAFSAFGAACGWLGYQSGNQHQTDMAEITINEQYGTLLNAELANDQQQTLHIRYDGQGSWVVVTFKFSEGGQYIADKVSYVSSFDDKFKLSYLRFWTLDDDGKAPGVNPVFACFTGFGGLR